MSYDSEILADSPLFYGKLNESSGTTMLDSSGNGRNGTYNGTMGLGATGILPTSPDTCADISGNSHAAVPDDAGLDSVGFTVSAIIRPDNLDSLHAIVNRDGNLDRGWTFYTNSNKLNSFGVITGTTSLVVGTTYHVAMVSTGSAVTLYLNGAADGTVAATVSNTLTNGLRIAGALAGTPGNNFPFDGKMSRVAYFGTALSGARIAAQHAAMSAPVAIQGTLAATLPGPLS